MEAIKFEFTLPDSFLQQLDEQIKKSVSEALKANVDAIRAEEKKLTRQEAAAMLKVSLPTLSKHIDRGRIKTERFGKRVLIPLNELENFLKQSA
jgi:excisionase family DNA binding protein